MTSRTKTQEKEKKKDMEDKGDKENGSICFPAEEQTKICSWSGEFCFFKYLGLFNIR